MRSLRLLFTFALLCTFAVAQRTTTNSTTDRATGSTSTTARATTDGRYSLPAGTEIEIRVNESLSSETSQQGDRFTGTVASDLVDTATGRVLIPRGAEVSGRVLSATPSGRLTESGELQLSINTIRIGNSVVNVTVQPFIDRGESHTKSNTTKIGGGAALGAIIGAIAGGGKGAAIGAGVGGAAGAGTAAATGKRPAEIRPEAVLRFVTATETTVAANAQLPSSRTSTGTMASTDSATTPSTPSYPQSTSTSDSGTYSTQPATDSDEVPVLQKRGNTSPTSTSTGRTNAGTTTAQTTTGTYGSTPPSTTASTTGTQPSNSSSGTYGSTTNTTGTTTGTYGQSYPSGSTATTSTGASSSVGVGSGTTTSTYPATASTTVPGRSFSARDRRVINNCVRDHASSLPDAALHKGTVPRTFRTGDSIPVDTQRQLRALPLQCDRELPTLSNDLERVIYGGQVMLIDTSNRVLDAFEITP